MHLCVGYQMITLIKINIFRLFKLNFIYSYLNIQNRFSFIKILIYLYCIIDINQLL